MPITKYIVNNLDIQTITGDLEVTGKFNSGGIGRYKALITKTGEVTGDNIFSFSGGLIIGETYTITNYEAGDDFSNVADVQSGTVNETFCTFIATGSRPANWSNASTLASTGNVVVNVVENTLGYELFCYQVAPGTYAFFINDYQVPISNSFSRDKTHVTFGPQTGYYGPPANGISVLGGPGSFNYLDDTVYIGVWDSVNMEPVDNYLYSLPIEITVLQDNTDTTPVQVYGTVTASYPFSNVAVETYGGSNVSGNFYTNSGVTVNNITELIAHLNSGSNPQTIMLGTYSADPDVEGGVILTMPTYLKNNLAYGSVLTFTVYSD